MLCGNSIKGGQYLESIQKYILVVFLLLLLISVHSVSLYGLCNMDFSIFKHSLHIIVMALKINKY